jgi:mono/diheme cytochrome c family protein
VELKPGFHPVRITSRAKRVQLTWEAKSFSREPIPPWKFRHVPVDLPEARGRERVGKLGCARCHRDAFPGVQDPPYGPSLADLGKRVNATWLMSKLDHAGPMTDDERKTLAATLLRGGTPRAPDPPGDHRMGRRHFVSVGCAACHFLPDEAPEDQPVLTASRSRVSTTAGHAQLAAFLADPKSRYPDGRMPAIPMPATRAR